MMRRILQLVVVASLFIATPALARDFQWTDAFKRANVAYNAEKYEEAVSLYVAAIQADPSQPAAYRNLARTYFWLDRYASAVAHYDNYLRLATGASDLEQIKSERRLASDRAGEAVWTMPDPQRLTRAALNDALEEGAAFTEGGGGAWGLYQTLLRTGYAQPELAQLRARLARRLLDEYEAALMTESTQPTPRLSMGDWQVQMERLSHARSVARDEAVRDVVDRRATIAEAALALLTGQSGEAAGLAELAATNNPDYAFVKWYEIVALMEADRPEDALEKLQAFARELATNNPSMLDYARVLRAEILRRTDRSSDSADLYWETLRD